MADNENTSVSDEKHIYEPQITSDNAEERKLARKLRIQRRIEVITKQRELKESPEVIMEVEKSLLDKQIESSAKLLELYLVEGEEIVTNVKVANDSREVTRREKEALRRSDILKKLDDESKQAEEMYNSIKNKWDVIGKYKDPLDISESIDKQKSLCNDIIQQKDELIKMLKLEINKAELRYVTDQDSQKEDVTSLASRIDNQVDLMRKAYREELKLIEETIALERHNVKETNTKKWEHLYKKRNIDEEENMQKKIQMADDFLKVFQETRVTHEENYRQTKISLEVQTENLQKELENLKAACLLNEAKLDYNYNILKKREDENMLIRSQQKRMINKLQDEINKLRRHMREYKENSEANIKKLRAEIIKTRNAIYQLEDKADHICSVNDKKFHDIWTLNEETANNLMERIKMSDKIIHEQLLGVEWKAPPRFFIKKTNLPSYKEAVEELKIKKQKEEFKESPTKVMLEDGKEIPWALMHSILDKIAFRSGFLVETVLHGILDTLTPDNQQLIKVDNVFNAMGITKPEHLKILATYFLPFARCPICERALKSSQDIAKLETSMKESAFSEPMGEVKVEASPAANMLKAIGESPQELENLVNSELVGDTSDVETPEESTATESSSLYSTKTLQDDDTEAHVQKIQQTLNCAANHPVYIENAHVFKILKQFVKAGYTGNEMCAETITLQKRIYKKRNSLSRLMSQEDVETFWGQYLNVFTKHHEELWGGLLYGLKRYHKILQNRKELYDAVVSLRKENSDLRHMLKNCSFEPKKKDQKDTKKKLSVPHFC